MPLSRIFLLCFAAGIAIGYFAVARPSRVEPPDAQPAASSPPVTSPSHPHTVTHPPVAAAPHKPTAAARNERQSLTARAPNLSRNGASPRKEDPSQDVARAQAQRLASDEPLTREDVRVLLEQVLAGKLPRDLTAKDYDRLADAVLRVRAAERILQTVEESPETTRVRAAQQNVITEAMNDVEEVTGMKPSELSGIIDPKNKDVPEGGENPAPGAQQ